MTARLTNSVNSIGMRAFNSWGGIEFEDVLNTYTDEIVDKVWDAFSRFVIQNYQSGKGTFIKGLGTFTFTNPEYSFEGATNQYDRDKKPRRPVFIVSPEFLEDLRPGLYNKGNGLIYYTQKLNNSVGLVKINMAQLSYSISISKEEYSTIFYALIKQLADIIRLGQFKERSMPGVGIFIIRRNVFGMKFNYDLFKAILNIPQKYIHTKKNIALFMETKQSSGVRQQDISDIDKAIRDIRPKTSVITHIPNSGEKWLKNSLNINLDHLEPDDTVIIEKPNQSNRLKKSGLFFLNQKPFRMTPKQDLFGLSIPQDVLEEISKHKDILLKNMKEFDRHNDYFIAKFELIQAFKKANVHHRLSIETIVKMVEIYGINQDTMDYPLFLNCLLRDINIILDKAHRNFPMERYKFGPQTKRAVSSIAFSRSCGNLSLSALSSIANYPMIYVSKDDVQSDIEKLQVIIPNIIKDINIQQDKIISFIELITFLQNHSISLEREQMIKILKYLNIPNPNAFAIELFVSAISNTSFKIPSDEISKETILNTINRIKNALPSFGGEDFLLKGNNYVTYDDFYSLIQSKFKGIDQRLLFTVFNYITNNQPKLTTEHYKKYLLQYFNRFDDNYETKALGIIVNKFLSQEKKSDSYFDHLLSYHICRIENIITLPEMERIFQLESLPFDKEEIGFIFKCIDTKHDDFIDREEWNNTMKKIHHPLLTMQNYIRTHKLDIEDILYKMELDPKNSVQMDKQKFKTKIKFIDEGFDNNYIYSLFNEIDQKGAQMISTNQVIEAFDIFKNESIFNSESINNKMFNELIEHFQSICDFTSLKRGFCGYDKYLKGKIPKEYCLAVFRTKSRKYKDELIMRFIRSKKLLDPTNNVLYPELCEVIFETAAKDNFSKCIAALKEFLQNECNNDIFLFFVKMNNMANASTMQKWISIEKLYEFFRFRVDFLQQSTIHKFDIDNDGLVSFEDLKEIITRYISPNFFSEAKAASSQDKMSEEKFKQMINTIKAAIKKKNMTEVNLFQFLDKDKDGYISYDEYNSQLDQIAQFNQEKKDSFFDYLDIYHHGLVNIEVFLTRIKMYMKKDHYIGNCIIESVSLSEFSKWYNRNLALSDTEVYSLLDHDSDGVISVADMKYFLLNTLNLSKHEIRDSKVMRLIQAISLTQTGNITLHDIRHFLTKSKANSLDVYYVKIKELCNEGVSVENTESNQDWIKEIIERLGMFISEKYHTVSQFFEQNCQDQKIKIEQLKAFISKNPNCFNGFAIEKDQIAALFSYLDSTNKKYLTLEDFEKKLNQFDYYKQMSQDIKLFFKQNFPSAIDAFKYFNNSINPDVSSISHKELFNGLNYLFPKKYSTETLLTYIRKTFPSSIDEISFSKFNYAYFENINFDETFPRERNRTPSKILTTRKRENIVAKPYSCQPFTPKDHESLQTPFDSDPLTKIKKIIESSKYDYSSFFNMNVMLSDHGYVNKYEFRNLIKKLNLGLTNIEIEDIIAHAGKSRDGRINLREFAKYLSREDQNLKISKQHIMNVLKQMKTLIYKYYSNPKLAFEFNDLKATQHLDFEKFKELTYDLYYRDSLELPNYAILKYVYDYIDIRKDGIIDLQEWNRIFATAEGSLDVNFDQNQMKALREWETSNNINYIYKTISKNKKIIKDKAKKYSFNQDKAFFIQTDNLINILKEVLQKVSLSNTQWRMLVSTGDKNKNGFIDFNTFISLIEASTNRRPHFK